MATAYVSPAGSAAYPGTIGAPTSLTTALSSAGAGDIVYLAPGSYRGTFTLSVSGTAGNTIQFIGDPLASQAIGGIAAGVVRVTNYLNDNANPTSATLLTATSRSYFSFTNVYFESFNTSNFLAILTTCANWSFEKCTFINVRSSGLNVTTSAGVPLNASFIKCTFSSLSSNVVLYCANHSSPYSLNLNFTDCICQGSSSQQLTVMSSTSSPGSQTNAGGINYFNCLCYGFMIQNYSTNTTQPSYVYNCVILNTSSFALLTQTSGSLIENYNVVFGSTNAVTAGANSFYAGSIGLDYGHSAIVGLPAPSVNGPYFGSRLLGAGTASGAPATDADGVAWYQSLLDMGAYTYAARNNVIAFPLTPTQTTITIAPASTSQSIELYLGATGLVFNTSGLAAYFVRNREAPTPITLVTQTPTGAWASGGFAEIDSSLVPGVYRLDVPNAAFAAGASDVTIVVRGASGTNGAVLTVTLSSGGLTAAQTAAAVWDEPYTSHTTASTFGARTLKTVADNRLVNVGTANHIEANVHAIVDSTAAADELKGALLHNGTDYISADLLTPVSAATSVHIGPFQLLADGLGADQPLDVNVGTATSIDVQVTDANGTGIDITGATVSAKVYSSAGTLVATYAGTATYADNGRLSFGLTTTVTNTSGTYTVTVTRTTGATDTQIFGPLRLYVRPA
jgi:hypothetical protein